MLWYMRQGLAVAWSNIHELMCGRVVRMRGISMCARVIIHHGRLLLSELRSDILDSL